MGVPWKLSFCAGDSPIEMFEKNEIVVKFVSVWTF